MKIAFNPSTVAALITPPNNKDITFDLRGRNIFARGVKFCGTDTWRDIKINNVSIGSNTLDLRNGSNATLTNTNGVVTINSTWRPVVDNLTSDSTTSSLSANQGRVLKALIDGKSDSEHNHDGRYLRLNGSDTMQGNLNLCSIGTSYIGKGLKDTSGADFTEANIVIRSWWGISFKSHDDIVRTYIDTRTGNIGTKGVLNAVGAVIQGRVYNGGDDEGIIVKPSPNGYAGLILGAHNGERSVFYFTKGNPFWRYNNGSTNLDILHPKKSGTIALTSDIPSSLKNPYSLTTFGVVYDGSAAKTVTTSTFISLVTEGTDTVTDGTMFITSWASNNGFADTNAVNVPYKRKAIHLWEYIKVKTDSLYATKGHNHDDRYLKLTGGIMTGTINRSSGGSTISGRDHAIIRLTYAPGGSSWNPIACVDTETGTWTLGHLSSGDSDTNFHFCFSTNTDYNEGNNNGNYVTLRNKVGTIALLSEIPDKNSWNYDDRYLKLTGGTMNGNARIGHGSGNLYIGNSGNDGWLAVQNICSQDSIGDGKWSIRVDGTASFQSIKFPSNRLIAQVSNGSNSPLKGIKLPDLQNNGIGIFSRVGNGADEGGIVLSEDTCVIYNSFDTGWGLSVRDKDITLTDISGDNTIAFGVRQDYRAYSLGGFEKSGSDNSYVLLGGGDHKLISDFATSNHTHSDYVTSLSTNGNYLTWTKNGDTSNITVPYSRKTDWLIPQGFFSTKEQVDDFFDTVNHSLKVAYIGNEVFPEFSDGLVLAASVPKSYCHQIHMDDNQPVIHHRSRNGGGDSWSKWSKLLDSSNYSSYAIPVSASCNKNWSYSGQSGQPTWLWGTNDGTNCYVWNPSNFRVAYATSAGNADTLDGIDSTKFLRQVVVPNNTENDFNTFSNMTLTGRTDPTTGASLKNAPWSGSGPAGGYGVLTYLFSGYGYGTQMAWGYGSNRIYIRNRYWGGSEVGSVWRTSWDTLALTSDIPTVTDYYWANVKVSASSSTSTSPTFGSLWINNSHFFKLSGTTFTCQGGTTFTLPSSSLNTNTALLWTTASDGTRDTGIFYNSSDFAFIANSNDHGAVFAVYDTDVTQDFEAGAREISVPGSGGALWARGGFSKSGSSNDYVLLGGGGHKAISDFSISGHTHSSITIPVCSSLDENSDIFRVEYAVGSNSVATKPSGVDAFGVIRLRTAAGWYGQIMMSANTAPGIYYRNANDLSSSVGWKKLLDSSNFNSYSPKLDGTGASGTWNISITGNANTVDNIHATGFLRWKGMLNIGSNAPFQAVVDIIKDTSKLNDGGLSFYSYAGDEYTVLIGSRNDATRHGNALKWGYANKYLWMIRMINGSPQSSDWEKISAGYADSSGNTDLLDGYHASGLFTNLSNSGNNISITIGGTNKTLTVGYASTATLVSKSLKWTDATGTTQSYNGGTEKSITSLNFPYNQIALNFRHPGEGYSTKILYMTAGNEALVFAAQNSVTSFIFKSGANITNSNLWYDQVPTPTLQLKGLSAYINKLIANGSVPAFNFLVNGSSRFDGKLWQLYSTRTDPNATCIRDSAIACFGEYDDDAMWIGNNTNNGTWILVSFKGDEDRPSKNYLYNLSLLPLGGNVGIGTNSPTEKLTVNGWIGTNGIYTNRTGSPTDGGISLYSNVDPMTYGIAFRGTGTYGTHGYVTSANDWATYLTMNDNTTRGWIFRRGDTNVASIAGSGNMAIGLHLEFSNGAHISTNRSTDYHYGYTFNLGDNAKSIGMYSGPVGEAGGVVISPDGCLIYNSSDCGYNLQVRDKDLGSDLTNIATLTFGIELSGYYAWSRGGFKKNGSSDSYVLLGGGGHKLESSLNVSNADTVDGFHATSLVKFYLSPMTNNAPADSAKSWFINTMPSGSGAIVYNVPGSEKTIIAGKSTGAYGHMLQLNYDDNYLRILRYYSGSWKTTDWEKISAGYADSAGSATKVIVNLHTGNDVNYPLVWSNLNNSNNATENQLYKSWSDLYYNPKNKRLTVGGSIYAAHFYESSDKVLKKNIKSILSSTNIPKIREFDWKDTGEHSYGFIALELEELGYGCLVSEANGKKTVNYTATLALTVAKLLNLINIQNKKISNLTKELKALKYGRKKNS